MLHDEHCGCGCGHDHNHETPKATLPVNVTERDQAFLHQLGHRHYLPVARFTVKDSQEKGFASTALAPVFLCSAEDDMETVKEMGAFLQYLEDMDLITLDYDMPLEHYGYEEYHGSALYAYFCKTVEQGATNASFLGDTPVLELGSIALTEAGEKLAFAHCDHSHEA